MNPTSKSGRVSRCFDPRKRKCRQCIQNIRKVFLEKRPKRFVKLHFEATFYIPLKDFGGNDNRSPGI